MFSRQVTITEELAGRNSHLSLKEMATLLVDTAGGHLTTVGLTGPELREYDLAWVIVKRNVEILNDIFVGDTVTFETRAGKPRHGMYPRIFDLKNNAGEVLAHVEEIWVVMDIKNRVMVDRTYFTDSYPEEMSEPVRYRKMQITELELSKVKERTADESETDVNGHINNAYFLRWADQVLGSEIESASVRKVYIEYAREILAGEKVTLRYGIDSEACEFYLKGEVEGEERFTVYFTFEK